MSYSKTTFEWRKLACYSRWQS